MPKILIGMKNILCLLALSIAAITIQAQPVDEHTFEAMIEMAENRYAAQDYYRALEWYEKAYKEQRHPQLARKIAETNFFLRDYRKAESWYKRLLRRDKENNYIADRFNYGRSLKMQGKNEQAYEEFLTVANNSSDTELIAKCKLEIDGIILADQLEENFEIVVKNAGKAVNSHYGEFSPVADPEGNLYFGSFNRKELIELDDVEGDYHAKIYIAQGRENEKGYRKPKALNTLINRDGFHTANVALTPDGQTMFITRIMTDGSQMSESMIYMAKKGNKGWGAAQALSGVNGDWIVKQPFPGELYGNPVLFFVSNMPGGMGGWDIYYSEKKSDTEYSEPVNLGEGINTAADEITPFYSDGTLYFSSEGYPSLGGLDVYKSTWNGSNWSQPENMGKGINTAQDDFYYNIDEASGNGFIVSNRLGTTTKSLKSKTCCDDIFTVEKRQLLLDLVATVFDEQGKALTGATVKLIEIVRNQEGTSESKTSQKGNTFKFALDQDKAYKAMATRPGYFPEEIEFNTVGKVADYTYNRKFNLKKKPVEPDVEIVTINEPIRLNNIYYDFDDDKILPDAEKDLRVLYDLLKEHKDMVIELSSHTDARGNDSYNQNLSERRAISAKRWLVNKGVDPERVQAVGYGEEFILNECENGVRCTDEQHRFNRRTEFKILEGPQFIEIRREVPKDNPKRSGSQSLDSNGVPQIRFEKKSYDLGAIVSGEKKKARLHFKNVGEGTLKIEMASACECTTVQWPSDAIAPKGEGFLDIEYNSEDKEGEQNVTIELIGNTQPILTEIEFKITVLPARDQ